MSTGIHVERNHLMLGIDTTGQENAGLAAIKIGCAEEMLRSTVTAIILSCRRFPNFHIICLAIFVKPQWIFHLVINLTCLSVQVKKILRILTNKPLTTAGCRQIVLRSIADSDNLSAGRMNLGSVRGTQHGFGLAVTVPVVGHDVLLVVLEVSHVGAPVDPPEFLTIQLIDLHDKVLTIEACLRIGLAGPTGIVELHQYLQLAVAVHVSHTGVVRNVGRCQRTVVGRNLQVVLVPHRGLLAGSLFSAANDSLYRVFAAGRTCNIGEVRHLEVVRYLRAVTVEVVRHVIVLLAQDAP